MNLRLINIWIILLMCSLGQMNAQDDRKKRIDNKREKVSIQTKKSLPSKTGLNQTHKKKRFLPHGGLFTPKGNIHALFIFVGIDKIIQNGEKETSFNAQRYGDWDIENGQALPGYIDPETGENNLVYSDISRFSENGHEKNRGISEYFHQMSLGEFQFTGEVLKDPETEKPVRIDVQPGASNAIQNLTYRVMDKMYERFPDFDWSRFDQRQNFPNYKFDNSKTAPDGKPDCIVFIYRSHNGMKHQVFNSYRVGWGGGIATSFLGGYTSKWDGVSFDNSGYTSSNESARDIEQLRSFFLHEIGHKLYAAPHYNGANGEIGDYFFYPSNAYGMMNTSSILNAAANGWERWVCGWIDIVDATGESSDLGQLDELIGSHDFYLEDFVTKGHAVRIKIPNTENQFLWIENHQKQSVFDESLSAGSILSRRGEVVPNADKGIYMYIERISADLSTIPRYGKRSDSNGIKLLHADGNWDYQRDSVGTKDWGNYHNNPIYTFRRLRRNPIGGTNPFMRYLDDFPSTPSDIKSKDGHMQYKNTVHGGYIESVDILQEIQGGSPHMLYGNFGGRNKEALEQFKRRSPFFQAGDEVGLSSPVCLVNLRKYDSELGKQGAFIPNGVKVQILNIEDGRAYIRVEFGDFEIRENTRWTGNISIQSNYMDSLKPGLILAEKTCLTIDKSGTPNRHLSTSNGDFISQSEFELTKNSIFELEEGAKFLLKDDSKLIIRNGATLILKNKAHLCLQDNAQVLIEEGAEIIYGSGADIKFKGTASQIEKIVN